MTKVLRQNLEYTAYVKKRHMNARLGLHFLDRFAEGKQLSGIQNQTATQIFT